MTENQNKLIEILKEMFQFDQADLDFGIYRIMNLKRKEISDYLENSLPKQISDGIEKLVDVENTNKIEELKKQIEATQNSALATQIKEDAINDLNTQIEKLTVRDNKEVESDVYNHLINFFSRYYDEGDFISQRRYKDGAYIIPYEGEEVKMYWANSDQYYVKTSENFNNYSFKTKYGKTITFKVVEAEIERDNNKENDKKFFCIHKENPFEIVDDELIIYFEYRAGDYKKQEEANIEIYNTLKEGIKDSEYISIFVAPNSKEKSEIEKQLYRYTAKNTYDYFIHKDLERFLNRELDTYIKNEVLFLEDMQTCNIEKTKEYLVKAQVIKDVSKKLIEFLSQIENFQRKLYLKKKFVIDTQYCVTLDRIPEKMYPEIIANDLQIEEWVKQFSINEIENQQGTLFDEDKIGYSKPLSVEFLKQNQFLVLDTSFFNEEFKEELIESFSELDTSINDLMINGDNFQILRLLEDKYKKQIKCCYIDPPYNAKSSEILYKNTFKHSSWLSMMNDRICQGVKMLKDDFVQIIAIDEVEQDRLANLLRNIFGENYNKDCIAVVHNPSGQQGNNFTYVHEYAFYIYKNSQKRQIAEQYRENEEDWDLRNFRDVTGDDSLRSAGANCFYPIIIKDNQVVGFGDVCSDDYHPPINVIKDNGYIEVYPVDPQGIERKWRFERGTVEDIKDQLLVNFIKNRKVYDIQRLKKSFNYKSMWQDAKYSANNYGTQLLNNMIPKAPFSYPKSLYNVEDSILAGLNGSNNDIVLDYFAGSGTTGHAVIDLNRKDKGNRRFILCEMGEYFDNVTKNRVIKAIYSQEWEQGKPKDRIGVSRMFKYQKLESYEDTLNNIEFDNKSEILLDDVKEEYTLKYMLENDSKESMFNNKKLEHPFNYEMNITTNLETKSTNIDLVETFNYLIGLVIEKSFAKRSYDATFTSEESGITKAKIYKGTNYTFKLIKGHSLSGEKILVIWRDMTDDILKDNAVLDAFLEENNINPNSGSYNKIYINCDNNVQNLNGTKVILIEEELQKRMFDY